MAKKKEKKRKPGRPWDDVPRVPDRIGRSVRFPPEEYALLKKASVLVEKKMERFILDAVKEKAETVIKDKKW